MKIVLLQSVRGLGDPGSIVNVKSGYARNYLIPNDMAIFASAANINKISHQIEKAKEQELKKVDSLQVIADKLNKLVLKFELKSGDADKLFGSVTTQMISHALAEQTFNIEKKDIIIPEPIKTLGNHQVAIYLHKDIKATIKVKVKAISE